VPSRASSSVNHGEGNTMGEYIIITFQVFCRVSVRVHMSVAENESFGRNTPQVRNLYNFIVSPARRIVRKFLGKLFIQILSLISHLALQVVVKEAAL